MWNFGRSSSYNQSAKKPPQHRLLKTKTRISLIILLILFPHASCFGMAFTNLLLFPSRSRTILYVERSRDRFAHLRKSSIFLASRSMRLPSNSRTNTLLHMASIRELEANLAVSLDRPLLPRLYPSPLVGITNYLLSIVLSKAFKTALIISFSLASFMSLLSRSSLTLSKIKNSSTGTLKTLRGKLSKLFSFFRRAPHCIPMPFDKDGWGVCTLASKKQIGIYMEYEFSLPEPNYLIPLDLGQQISMCCMDDKENVVQGSFYPFGRKELIGGFNIVLPLEDEKFQIGDERAAFVSNRW